MPRSWILRLRLKAPRRMTTLLEGSKNQMGMMGGFSPLLEKLIFLTKNYLFLSRTQIEGKGYFIEYSHHHVRGVTRFTLVSSIYS